MAKATLYDTKGKNKSEITLPEIFNSTIRADIVQKYFEADKFPQPHATNPEAGKRQSASGTISHKRHDWKGHYGRGISRIPRKTMWRRGTQFYWVGANIPGTKGGRRAHPPKGIGKEKSINKKEIQIAMNSALAATINKQQILNRYETLETAPEPAVIEKLPEKTKDFLQTLNTIFKNIPQILKQKTIRPGKGKSRGRKYKSNAGLLILTGEKEKPTTKQIQTIPINEVTIADLYPLGRLTLFTKQAIEEVSSPKSQEPTVLDDRQSSKSSGTLRRESPQRSEELRSKSESDSKKETKR